MSDHLPVLCNIAVQLPEIAENKYLDLKIYLEGAFNGTNMNTGLNTILPASQPFNQAPWYYDGDEFNPTLGGSSVVDWILVELRETSGGAEMATGNTKIWEQACILMSNGSIVSADGFNLPRFDTMVMQNIYPIVQHRNHLDVMTANPLALTDSVYHYDFSTSAAKVYNGAAGYKELSPGLWGLVSGDGNGDGSIDILDKELWVGQAGKAGYFSTDFKMDARIDNTDKNEYWRLNQTYSSQVPE
jgi:hypothetical protein